MTLKHEAPANALRTENRCSTPFVFHFMNTLNAKRSRHCSYKQVKQIMWTLRSVQWKGSAGGHASLRASVSSRYKH